MDVVRVTSKGQATLPKRLREKVGIRAPGRVVVREAHGAIVVEPVPSLDELEGKYRRLLRGTSLNALLRELREAETDRDRRLPRSR